MERPKSSAADISREIRGWGGFLLALAGVVLSAGIAKTVAKTMVNVGQAKPEQEPEFEEVK